MNYNYFCDYCGERFTSAVPPVDPDGIPADVPCPRCGSHCAYPDTEAEARASVNRLTDYENKQDLWDD